MSKKQNILITRPLIHAQRYAAELAELGYDSVVEPMLVFESLDFEVPDLTRYQGLLFTSSHGLKVFVEATDVRDVPAFCVGARTAQTARESGFSDVHEGDGDAGKLAADIAAKCAADIARPFLHVRGARVTKPLHVLLAARGFQVDLLLAYKAVQVDHMCAGTLETLRAGEIDAALFFSARTAQAFAGIVAENKLEAALAGIKILSISDSVLECLKDYNWAGTYVARTPNKAGMTQLICETLPAIKDEERHG